MLGIKSWYLEEYPIYLTTEILSNPWNSVLNRFQGMCIFNSLGQHVVGIYHTYH